jgi:acetyl-CoA/propionyl-CoA carboxylase biotin carboxyl carrier protein
MPGAVVAVRAAVGDDVREGEVLLVVEAMKMEHALTAKLAGTVTDLTVRVGDQVVVDQLLATVAPRP